MALSASVVTRLEKIRHQFPTEQALLIPALHFVQEESGYLSMQSLRDIGEFLHLPLAKVREVVSFYTMFNQEPVGKVHLQLCTNISCWLNGSDKLLSCLKKRLNINGHHEHIHGETTSDGRYTLTQVECLASCGTAPVLQVNEDYHEGLNEEKLNRLMDDLDRQLASGQKNIGCSTRQEHGHV
jgi:NADH-quinone oxidoreductase subunit E